MATFKPGMIDYTFSKYIKSIDQFGYPVHLSFNKNGENEHKTLFGGFVSVMINVVVLVFSVYNIILFH